MMQKLGPRTKVRQNWTCDRVVVILSITTIIFCQETLLESDSGKLKSFYRQGRVVRDRFSLSPGMKFRLSWRDTLVVWAFPYYIEHGQLCSQGRDTAPTLFWRKKI